MAAHAPRRQIYMKNAFQGNRTKTRLEVETQTRFRSSFSKDSLGLRRRHADQGLDVPTARKRIRDGEQEVFGYYLDIICPVCFLHQNTRKLCRKQIFLKMYVSDLVKDLKKCMQKQTGNKFTSVDDFK